MRSGAGAQEEHTHACECLFINGGDHNGSAAG